MSSSAVVVVVTVALVTLVSRTSACQVSGGTFLQIVQVEEELEVGTVVGRLDLDHPSQAVAIGESEANRYYGLVQSETGYSFRVKEKIDADTGVGRLQALTLSCRTLTGLTLQIEIEFEVRDVNDHAPVFLPTASYTFTVSESVPPGAQIGTVKAVDDDIKNAFITYELLDSDTSHKPVFYVEDMNGGAVIKLSSEQKLDYESRRRFELTVVARDCQSRMRCSENQRQGRASVTVVIEDADDLGPRFDQLTYQVTLPEDAAEGDLVVQVHAMDQDELNDAVLYTLSGTGSEYFHAHRATGEVTVRSRQGLVSGQSYLLQATAYQLTDPSKKDTSSLIVTVVASDSHIPKFTEREQTVSVSEYTPVNRTLLQIPLIYDQSPQAQPLDIRVMDNTDDTFGVVYSQKQVALVLSRPLDYELISQYYLTITASNGKHEGRIRITVDVLNENDNNPKFSQSSYDFRASGTEEPAGRVRATDLDQADDQLTYRIRPSDVSEMFEIKSNGELYLTRPLSAYTQREYTLLVEAEDSQDPPRTANAVVTVRIHEANGTGVGQSSASSGEPGSQQNLFVFLVAGISALVGITCTIVTVFLCKRRWFKERRKPSSAPADKELSTPDQAVLPLYGGNRMTPSALNSLDRGCTYRDMCELNEDESYRHVWRNNADAGEPEERSMLLRHKDRNFVDAAGSDSGMSSESRGSPYLLHAVDVEGTTPKPGYLKAYLQERRRQSRSPAPRDSPLARQLVEAPEGFRGVGAGGRSPSPAPSVESSSNTSDYGSNMADDTSRHPPTSTLIVISPRHTKADRLDSPTLPPRTLTTFHSD